MYALYVLFMCLTLTLSSNIYQRLHLAKVRDVKNCQIYIDVVGKFAFKKIVVIQLKSWGVLLLLSKGSSPSKNVLDVIRVKRSVCQVLMSWCV